MLKRTIFSPLFWGGGDRSALRVRRYARSMAASEIQVPRCRSRTSCLSILSDVTGGRVVCWVRVIAIFFSCTPADCVSDWPYYCALLSQVLCCTVLRVERVGNCIYGTDDATSVCLHAMDVIDCTKQRTAPYRATMQTRHQTQQHKHRPRLRLRLRTSPTLPVTGAGRRTCSVITSFVSFSPR